MTSEVAEVSVENLANEWGQPVAYIVDLIKRGDLVPSVRLPMLSGKLEYSYDPPEWQGDGFLWNGVPDPEGCTLEAGTWRIPYINLGIVRYAEGRGYLRLQECFLNKEGNSAIYSISFDEGQIIEDSKFFISDLVISRSDIERYEVQDMTKQEEPELSEQGRDALLRTIGALAEMYIERSDASNLTRSGKPNISALGDAIIGYLERNRCDLTGMAESTLAARLRSALDAIDNTKSGISS